MPAVGLYCMELESRSNDKCLVSKRCNIYPWVRWNPNITDRVIKMQPDIDLVNSNTVESLSRDIACLTVCDIGLMCDIPAVSRHLSTDISLEQNISLADDDVLHKHASVHHLEAADELLTVLSDAVCLRVIYQDAKCHVCLLQQYNAGGACTIEANNSDFSVPQSSSTPDNNLVEFIACISVADSLQKSESESDQCLGPSHETGFYDVRMQHNNHTVDAAVFSCCDASYHTSTQQSEGSTSSDLSSEHVRIIELLGKLTT